MGADEIRAQAEAVARVDAKAAAIPPEEPHTARADPYRIGVAVWLLAILALVTALYVARAFIVPLLIGILASYSLRPLVDALERRWFPRAVAAAVVLATLTGSLVWMGFSLRDDAEEMIHKLPQMARDLRRNVSEARGSGPTPLQQVQKAASELQLAAVEATGNKAPPRAPETVTFTWLNDYLLTQSKLLIAVIAQAPLVLMLTYILLASGQHFRRKLIAIVGPSLSTKKATLGILHEIDAQVQRYMLVTLVTNVLTGMGTWGAFELLGMPVAGLWGVTAGVLHFIPYFGPAVVAIASGVAGFLHFGSWGMGLAVASASLVVAGMAGLLFMPWLQSRFSHTNAAVLFIVLIFFGWLWGSWGLLLGAPLLATFKVICDRVEPLQRVGELIGR